MPKEGIDTAELADNVEERLRNRFGDPPYPIEQILECAMEAAWTKGYNSGFEDAKVTALQIVKETLEKNGI